MAGVDDHLTNWQAETFQPEGERNWLHWIGLAETLAGHDLDGSQSEDGYSMDGALDAFEAGQSPQEYVALVKAAG